MSIIILKILIAHFLGDFALQPTHWVKDKNKKKIRSKYLYLHTLIHFLLLAIIFLFNFEYLEIIIGVTVGHFLIDILKITFLSKSIKNWSFWVDQLLHIALILFLAFTFFNGAIKWELLNSIKVWAIIFGVIFLLFASPIIMKQIMQFWFFSEDKEKDSLKNAGMIIGVLERLFVFAFILLSEWSAIGLLIAAKSVFRFGDLSRAKDRKLTEYILIGTLFSFGIAFVIGVFVRRYF
ncbi:MAG: DUF3307 domain-containing protein [Flavobacteriales bacterium]|jgi:hypothetical protein|nr:DUF3307 domain-containing protein [Flavobacteriales bacterium]